MIEIRSSVLSVLLILILIFIVIVTELPSLLPSRAEALPPSATVRLRHIPPCGCVTGTYQLTHFVSRYFYRSDYSLYWEMQIECGSMLNPKQAIAWETSQRDKPFDSFSGKCPTTGLTHFYDNIHGEKEEKIMCQCPTTGLTHFYPALLKPAISATFRAHFCMYFSEYSDNSPKTEKNRAESKLYFSKYNFELYYAWFHYSWNPQP